MADANAIIGRYNQLKNESGRSNFENRWEEAAEYCDPKNNNINKVTTAGERKPVNRLIDVGISSNKMFQSGLSSYLVPSGTRFFKYGTSNPTIKDMDEIKRYFNDVTEITYDILNNSNFFQEFNKCLGHLGSIGTSCLLVEPSASPKFVNFKSYYINSYYIAEDAFGMVDTVYFELSMSARQVIQLFGEDNVSLKIRNDAEDAKRCDNEYTIIHAIEPNKNAKKGGMKPEDRPISSIYVELDSKEVIKSTGYYEMPYAVGRFYQSNNEKYGRSPAMECMSTLSMVNAMELTRIRSAHRVSNPPWLLPDDDSVHRVSGEGGSKIFWDANNPQSKPQQIDIKDNVIINDQMIEIKIAEIKDAFFQALFNPLIDRQNMTATESSQRMQIALQNLVPAIGRMTTELLIPIFKRMYFILMRAGVYPEMPQALMEGGEIQIGFTSKATMAEQQLEILGTYQTLEAVGMLVQMGQEDVLDNYDLDAIARGTAEANSVPNNFLRSERDVKMLRKAREEQQQQAQAMDQQAALAESYNNTSKAPEAGSPADLLMAQSGI